LRTPAVQSGTKRFHNGADLAPRNPTKRPGAVFLLVREVRLATRLNGAIVAFPNKRD
jgi:hypothetical protein